MRNTPTRYGPVNSRQLRALKEFASFGFDPSKRGEAIVRAGYRTKNPASAASSIFGTDKMRALLHDEMAKQGLTIEKIVKKHAQLLDAEHPNPKFLGADDNEIQLRALDMAYKIYDVFPDKKIKIDEKRAVFHFDIKTLKKAEEVTGEDIVDAEEVLEIESEQAF